MRGIEETTCPRCGLRVIPDRIRRRRAQVYKLMGKYSQREIAILLGVSQSCIRKDISAIRSALGIPVNQTVLRPGPRKQHG